MNRSSTGIRLKLFLILLFAIVMLGSSMGKEPFNSMPPKTPVKDVTDSVFVHYEQYKKEFGKNKEIPPAYEKQVLYALSYFPELADTRIKFQVIKSKSGIIDTRPTTLSVLRRSSQRQYLINIYDSFPGRTLPCFSNAAINAQVGILGHELSHILYFNNSTGLGLIGLGIAHVSTSYIDRFENRTDSMDIVRGLGYQLIAWKQFLEKGFKAMQPVDAPPSERSPGRERYMSVERVREVMVKSGIYQ